VRRRLQQQRRFADPRFTANQDERSRHDPPAQDAVELVDARGKALGDKSIDIGVELRSRRRGKAVALFGRRSDDGLRCRTLLNERVPRPALGAAPQPFGRLSAAFLAGEHYLLFHGRLTTLRVHLTW
jgi:hypothetical protein